MKISGHFCLQNKKMFCALHIYDNMHILPVVLWACNVWSRISQKVKGREERSISKAIEHILSHIAIKNMYAETSYVRI